MVIGFCLHHAKPIEMKLWHFGKKCNARFNRQRCYHALFRLYSFKIKLQTPQMQKYEKV